MTQAGCKVVDIQLLNFGRQEIRPKKNAKKKDTGGDIKFLTCWLWKSVKRHGLELGQDKGKKEPKCPTFLLNHQLQTSFSLDCVFFKKTRLKLSLPHCAFFPHLPINNFETEQFQSNVAEDEGLKILKVPLDFKKK